jgi:hypothetical protein
MKTAPEIYSDALRGAIKPFAKTLIPLLDKDIALHAAADEVAEHGQKKKLADLETRAVAGDEAALAEIEQAGGPALWLQKATAMYSIRLAAANEHSKRLVPVFHEVASSLERHLSEAAPALQERWANAMAEWGITQTDENPLAPQARRLIGHWRATIAALENGGGGAAWRFDAFGLREYTK